ncbi:MAG: hypothetical protein WC838_05300, partial [Candidatus Margulisiibacteriota bacterium]
DPVVNPGVVYFSYMAVGNIGSGFDNVYSKAGTIGIGTNSPGGKLHINTATSTEYGLILSANDEGAGTLNGGSPYLLFTKSGTTAGPLLKAVMSSDGSYGKRDLVLMQHNSSDYSTLYEALRVHANGNVGIGTTSPQAKLDVRGNENVKAFNVNGHSLTSFSVPINTTYNYTVSGAGATGYNSLYYIHLTCHGNNADWYAVYKVWVSSWNGHVTITQTEGEMYQGDGYLPTVTYTQSGGRINIGNRCALSSNTIRGWIESYEGGYSN